MDAPKKRCLENSLGPALSPGNRKFSQCADFLGCTKSLPAPPRGREAQQLFLTGKKREGENRADRPLCVGVGVFARVFRWLYVGRISSPWLSLFDFSLVRRCFGVVCDIIKARKEKVKNFVCLRIYYELFVYFYFLSHQFDLILCAKLEFFFC